LSSIGESVRAMICEWARSSEKIKNDGGSCVVGEHPEQKAAKALSIAVTVFPPVEPSSPDHERASVQDYPNGLPYTEIMTTSYSESVRRLESRITAPATSQVLLMRTVRTLPRFGPWIFGIAAIECCGDERAAMGILDVCEDANSLR